MTKFLSRIFTSFMSRSKSCTLKLYFRFHTSNRILSDAPVTLNQKRRSYKSLKEEESKKKKLSLSTISLLIIPITSFGLGVWQIYRKKWKENLISQLNERQNQKPVPLPLNLEDVERLEYCPVTVKGKFHHDREIFLGPRTLILKKGKSNLTPFSGNSSGFLVVTPFEISGNGKTILVNRGWIPHNLMKDRLKKTGTDKQDDKEIELTGFVRLNEKKQNFGMKNSPESRIFIYRDLYKMAEITNAEPIFIDADSSFSEPGGPIAGQTRVSVRNEHLTYICTWFGLSIASGGLWYLRFIRFPNMPW